MSILSQALAGIIHQNHISAFDPAQQQVFGEVVQTMVKHYGVSQVLLTNSVIGQYNSLGRLYIQIDLTELLRGTYTLQFPIDALTAPDLTGMVGSEDTLYYDCGDHYFVTNGNWSITLAKVEPQHAAIPCPVMDSDHFGQPIADINLKALKAYLGKQTNALIVLFDDQFEQVQHGIKSPFTFTALTLADLHGKTPSHILQSSYFLSGVTKNGLTLQMARNDYGFWLVTTWQTAHKLTITTYELLVEM
jgi:hypothetical protein